MFNNYDMIRLVWKTIGDDNKLTGDTNIPVYNRLFEEHALTHAKSIIRGKLSNNNIIWRSAHVPENSITKMQFNACFADGTDANYIRHHSDKFVGICYIRHYMTKTLSEFINQKFNRTDVQYNKTVSFSYFWRINVKTKEKIEYIHKICNIDNKFDDWHIIKFPLPYKHQETDKSYKQIIENINNFTSVNYVEELSLNNLTPYKGWNNNGHHFNTKDHYSYIMPILAKMCNIPFNINDFKYKNTVYNNKYTITKISPFANYNYTIYIDNKTINCDYTYLSSAQGFCDKQTPYHNLFCGSHRCCKIVNNTINNNKVLLISCNSQMIPLIPVLSVYYKTIIHLDNRDNVSYKHLYNNEKITDKLLCLSYDNDINKFTINNLL